MNLLDLLIHEGPVQHSITEEVDCQNVSQINHFL
jgi:hypothetical protein